MPREARVHVGIGAAALLVKRLVLAENRDSRGRKRTRDSSCRGEAVTLLTRATRARLKAFFMVESFVLEKKKEGYQALT